MFHRSRSRAVAVWVGTLAALLTFGGGADAATITVPAGGDLQTALNAAQPGDTILLAPGATYTGNFKLPAHAVGTFVTIRSAAAAALVPAPGVRVTPAAAAQLPKIKSPNSMPALTVLQGASHWRLQLLEFQGNAGGLTDIIRIGSATEATPSRQPHHIVLDRLYIHGDPAVGQKNGIVAHAEHFELRDSYVADIKQYGVETHAFISYNGAGPYLLENNYLEASGVNVMIGGANPVNAAMVPSNITVRHNHVAKNVAWMTRRPEGNYWTVKNLFELKSGRDVLVEGNLFEHNWSGAGDQPGYAILFRTENQTGTCDWCETGRVVFQNNIVRKTPGAISLNGLDYPQGGAPRGIRLHDVTVRNNLFTDIDVATWKVTTGNSSAKFAVMIGSERVAFDHNTMIMGSQTAAVYFSGAEDSAAFVYTNNLTEHENYGMKGDSTAIGMTSLAAYTINAIVTGNVLAGGTASLYPAGNYFPWTANWTTQFVDFASRNYKLASSSPYRNGGTDGKDIGVDFTELLAVFGSGLTAPDGAEMSGQVLPEGPSPEIVLYASQAARLAGDYALVADTTAAGGLRLRNPNRNAAKVYGAAAAPVNYAEFTFHAEAGRPYQVWFRGKAENNSWANDSMFVQFSGVPAKRIGSTDAMTVTLEDGVNAGLSGWGWQDDGFGVGVMGVPVVFESTGPQVIRLQPREDGLSIDQIVISPQQFLGTAPGAVRDDATVVAQ